MCVEGGFSFHIFFFFFSFVCAVIIKGQTEILRERYDNVYYIIYIYYILYATVRVEEN